MSEIEQRDLIRRFCKESIVRLRALLKKHPPKDSPCATCAFAPRTDDWPGFEATVYGLMLAIEQGKPFLCHRNMQSKEGEYVRPDPKDWIPCAGYEAIRGRPEAVRAIIKAACVVKVDDEE